MISASPIDPPAGPRPPGDSPGIASKVRDLSRRERLFDPAGTVVIMASGGRDSLALLYLLATGELGRYGPSDESVLHVLHVNHHLRGAESGDDEALVRRHCELLGVPCSVRDAPVQGKSNIQERARRLRWQCAEEVATELQADRVALGHTLDDQVETLIYRMGRYGGLPSLSGMRVFSGRWVRPLLGVRRSETEAYCRAHGLEFAEDRGNVDLRYARTRIRADVIPAWEAALPGSVEAAARTAEVAEEAHGVVTRLLGYAALEVAPAEVAGWFVPATADALSVGEEAGKTRPAPEWSAERMGRLVTGVRRALLHSLLENLDVTPSRALVIGLEELGRRAGTGEVGIGGDLWVEKAYDRLRVVGNGFAYRMAAVAAAEEDAELPVPGETEWGGLLVSAERVSHLWAPDPEWEAFLDARAVPSCLTVRGAAPGDRMHPIGAPGTRAVQDILVDARVPAPLRSRLPVVTDGDRILWIGGLAVAEESRIKPGTRDIVRIAVESCGGGAQA